MSSDREMQTWQRAALYSLLTIKALNKGIIVKGLDKEINRQMAVMTDDDITVVKQRINEHLNDSEA
jgi:hypothetical protein